MSDLAARLRAMVEERLAVARAAAAESWWWSTPDAGSVAEVHIALNDPADVILASERDLAVLERHGLKQRVTWVRDLPDHPARPDADVCGRCLTSWPCDDIIDLARRYRVEVDG